MKEEYIITENIGFNQIETFVNDYKILLEKKENDIEYSLQSIRIIFQPELKTNNNESKTNNNGFFTVCRTCFCKFLR